MAKWTQFSGNFHFQFSVFYPDETREKKTDELLCIAQYIICGTLKFIVTITASGKLLTGSDILLLFTLALLSDIVNRCWQSWKQYNLIILTLNFVITRADKVSFQALGGMDCKIIIKYKQ